jgi:type II secretory pathway pseudopilin PulG
MATTGTPALRRRIATEEVGLSLMELMVAMVVLLLVMGAVLSLFETTTKIAPKDQEAAHAVRDAQVGLERRGRELRQSTAVNATTASTMDVNVRIGTQDWHVVYHCDVPAPDDPANPYDNAYRRCVRLAVTPTTAALPAIGSGKVVIDRILNGTPANPVFAYSPNATRPTFVRARIEVPSRGERASGYNRKVVLDDGFYLRNLDLSGG